MTFIDISGKTVDPVETLGLEAAASLAALSPEVTGIEVLAEETEEFYEALEG